MFSIAVARELGVKRNLGGGEFVRPAQRSRVHVENVHGVFEDDHHLLRIIISGDEKGANEVGNLRRRSETVLERQNDFPLQVSLLFVPGPGAEKRVDRARDGDETGRETLGAAEDGQDIATSVVLVKMAPEELTRSERAREEYNINVPSLSTSLL